MTTDTPGKTRPSSLVKVIEFTPDAKLTVPCALRSNPTSFCHTRGELAEAATLTTAKASATSGVGVVESVALSRTRVTPEGVKAVRDAEVPVLLTLPGPEEIVAT
jgi:hypothetical protein